MARHPAARQRLGGRTRSRRRARKVRTGHADPPLLPLGRHHALRRFWKSARGFWHGPTARLAWGLIALLIMVTVFQLLVQYRLNLWNRDFFNALEFRNAAEIWRQTQLLLLFAAASIGLAVTAVWGRMTFQRSWRGWVSRHLIAAWLGDERYRRIDLWNGEHQNAEYRIAEDARQATDAPIDLVIGLLASALTAGTFVVVLWNVGGALDVSVLGIALTIPGYLVVAAVAYATLTTGTLMFVERRMIGVIESKNQAESELNMSSPNCANGPAPLCRSPTSKRRRRKQAWRCTTSFTSGEVWPGSTCAPPTSPMAIRCWRRWPG
jgi:ABC-type uncharacterized transport system fused permease/ATPase subunit